MGIISRMFRSFSLPVLKISAILNGSTSIASFDEDPIYNKRTDVLPGRELISPCSCTGSVKWVHRACINQWRYSQLVNLMKTFSQSLLFDSGILKSNLVPTSEKEKAILSCLKWIRWSECLRLKRVISEFFSKFAIDSSHHLWLRTPQTTWFGLLPQLNASSIVCFNSDSILLLRDAILCLFGLDGLMEPMINADAILCHILPNTDPVDQESTPYRCHLSGNLPGNVTKRHPFLNCDLCRAPYQFSTTVAALNGHAHLSQDSPSDVPFDSPKAIKRTKRWSVWSYLAFVLSLVAIFFAISTLSKAASRLFPNASHHPMMHFAHSRATSYDCYLQETFCCLEEFISIFLSEFTIDAGISYGYFGTGDNFSTFAFYESPSPKCHKLECSDMPASNARPSPYGANNSSHMARKLRFSMEDSFVNEKYYNESYSDGSNAHTDNDGSGDFFIQSTLQLVVLLFRGLMLVICGPPLVAFLVFRIFSLILPFASIALLLSLQGLSLVSLLFIAEDYLLSSILLVNMLVSISIQTSNFFTITVGSIASFVGIVNLLYLVILLSDRFSTISIESKTGEKDSKQNDFLANRFYWNIQSRPNASNESEQKEEDPSIDSEMGVALSL